MVSIQALTPVSIRKGENFPLASMHKHSTMFFQAWQRHIQVEDLCYLCNIRGETLLHTFFECPVVLRVLAVGYLSSAVFQFQQPSEAFWIQDIVTRLEDETVEKVGILLQIIWGNRIKKTYENSERDPLVGFDT